jgi:flagellar basal-body rod protein FlgB
MNSRLTETLDFHANALLLRAERQKVLAGNIANADTPRYVSRDFDFKSALAAATAHLGGVAPKSGPGADARPATSGPVPVTVTSSGHLGGIGGIGGGTGGPGRLDATALKYRVTEQASVDGNTVDLDRERANFADNAVRYEAGLRFINGSVRTMLSAIRGE